MNAMRNCALCSYQITAPSGIWSIVPDNVDVQKPDHGVHRWMRIKRHMVTIESEAHLRSATSKSSTPYVITFPQPNLRLERFSPLVRVRGQVGLKPLDVNYNSMTHPHFASPTPTLCLPSLHAAHSHFMPPTPLHTYLPPLHATHSHFVLPSPTSCHPVPLCTTQSHFAPPSPTLHLLTPTACHSPPLCSTHCCTFDYNSYRISSPELQDLFLVELVTLLFEALFSFLIPNSQHTHRR